TDAPPETARDEETPAVPRAAAESRRRTALAACAAAHASPVAHHPALAQFPGRSFPETSHTACERPRPPYTPSSAAASRRPTPRGSSSSPPPRAPPGSLAPYTPANPSRGVPSTTAACTPAH